MYVTNMIINMRKAVIEHLIIIECIFLDALNDITSLLFVRTIIRVCNTVNKKQNCQLFV